MGLTVWRNIPETTPEWERDFLVVEEHLPAGTTLIEGSVQTSASSYTLADGVLTFYFAPIRTRRNSVRRLRLSARPVSRPCPPRSAAPTSPVDSTWASRAISESCARREEHRSLSPVARRALRPGQGPLRRRPFHRGGRRAGAALRRLHAARRRRQGCRADAPADQHQGIRPAQGRAVLRGGQGEGPRADPRASTSCSSIGKAYRDINEYERAMIVWRGLIEASYLEDARVGELLRQRGKTLEAMAYLIDLWRSYPNTASIESDFFGLSADPGRGRRRRRSPTRTSAASWPTAGVTRSELLLQTIRMIQVFLSQSPTNPMADEASLAWWARSWNWRITRRVVKLAGRFAKLYPKSTYLDSFQYSEALAELPPRPVRPGRRGGRDDRQGRLQGCRRGRSAQPQQVAGDLHPGPDLRRPPRSPARPWSTTARSPTGSPTRPARSSSTRART